MGAEEYTKMWERLNMDIDAHQGLLEVLGKFYGDIYLSQQNRLKGMEYLDLVISEIHGQRVLEIQEAKSSGRKVIGTFCVFVPEEIIWALDGIAVGLCAGAQAGYDRAEQILPRNLCPLIKSFVGFKLARLCPFMESCDLIIGETTCDGKKKAYEIFSSYVPMFVMEVPQRKDKADEDLLLAEIKRLINKLEEISGNKLTYERLKDAIKLLNQRRMVLQRLNELRKAIPVPISGRDVLLVNQISFYDDPKRFITHISALCDEMEEKVKRGEGVVSGDVKRVMISGSPMAVPNWKLPYVIESSGAVIVLEESCVGTRNIKNLVHEEGDTLDDLILNLANRYLKIDCACFTPNEERLNNIISYAKEYNVDGVIHYHLNFCQPYEIEAHKVGRALKEHGIPFLSIGTDYSMEDIEQLKTRVEAFLEMI